MVRVAHNIANGPYAGEVKGAGVQKFVAATKSTPTFEDYHPLTLKKLLVTAGVGTDTLFLEPPSE